MPQVSIIILTKNRAALLSRALQSVAKQSFKDFEIVVVNDGSTDNTETILASNTEISDKLHIIRHKDSKGITLSRQEALEKCSAHLVALLDDDDEWLDKEKLAKQTQWFYTNPQGVLCGGSIAIGLGVKNNQVRRRPETDSKIRNLMLLKNSFFTSTVMFKKSKALEVGGFRFDGVDLAEDYDLWLRLGKLGQMYNFQTVFTRYALPTYDKQKVRLFFIKQRLLIAAHGQEYPMFTIAKIILALRIFWLQW